MKFLITGAKGQLGIEFVKLFTRFEADFVAFSREELDVSKLEEVLAAMEEFKPDVVVNCAAYNLVDQAETESFEAFKVNALGARNIAFACKKYGAFLVHYSTDYVFDGTKMGLYTEEDTPNPINEYGKSKYFGENLIKEVTDEYLILRTSWVYGEGTQNFIYKVLTWVEKQDVLRIVCDEYSVPTSAFVIVEITLKALREGLIGTYHLVNTGYASRYEWAKEILALKGIPKFIYPACQDDFNLPAKRPRFSAMSNEKISTLLNAEIPHWKDELKRFILSSSV